MSSEHLAVEALPDDETRYLHECEDGHHWTEQPDGGVSPSWGFGLTSLYHGRDPRLCPEPERGHSLYTDDQGNPVGPFHGYKCPSCGEVHYCGGCLIGVRTDPWNTPDPECEPPAPACGKPAVKTARWMRVKKLLPREVKGKSGTYEYKPGWTATWVPIDEAGQAAPVGSQLDLFAGATS